MTLSTKQGASFRAVNSHPKPRDYAQRAKRVVDVAVGLVEDPGPTHGREGGLARAKALSPERRSEIARNAALARHHGKVSPSGKSGK